MRSRDKVQRLSPGHKDRMAQGRREGYAIRQYLLALEAQAQPEPGRPRVSAKQLEARITALTDQLGSVDVLERVQLRQRIADLQARLTEARAHEVDMPALEKGFIKMAAAYSERKGITFAAWRAEGVPVRVLKAAGISQTQQQQNVA